MCNDIVSSECFVLGHKFMQHIYGYSLWQSYFTKVTASNLCCKYYKLESLVDHLVFLFLHLLGFFIPLQLMEIMVKLGRRSNIGKQLLKLGRASMMQG